jgi:TolB-like protein/tetratricopeptide (TPR) repeat protein
MVAILDREPPRLSSIQPLAPPSVDRLIARCLVKRPDERWQSAAELVRQLQSAREDSTASSPTAVQPRAPWRRASIVTIGLFTLVAALVASIVRTPLGRWVAGPAETTAVQQASLAVLPVRSVDSPKAEAAHLGVGIADAIVTRLANVHSIRVRPTSAILAFEAATIDPVAAARQLQVEHVLAGTVRQSEDKYRFDLQLIHAGDGVLVWGRQIDVDRRDLFFVEDQVTTEVVAALKLQIPNDQRQRLSQPTTHSPDAYDEYLQGRALLANYSDSNLRQAMGHFERALKIDSNYVLADAGFAIAASIFSVRYAYQQQAIEWGRQAEAHAQRSLKGDPDLAEAHLALANAAGTLYRHFDWPTVIAEAQTAVRLNPNLDMAHSALARAFYHLGLLDRSDLESRRAEDISGNTNLEVRNIEIRRVHVYSQLLEGHYQEAQEMAEALLRRTDMPAIRQYHGLAVFYAGDRTRAQDLLASVRQPDGRVDVRTQASLAGVFAANGRRDDARRTIRAVLEGGYMDHHVAYALGAAEAQLGNAPEAVKWLRSAAETGFPCYPWVERDALLNPIRSESSFRRFETALRGDYERARKRYDEVGRVQ